MMITEHFFKLDSHYLLSTTNRCVIFILNKNMKEEISLEICAFGLSVVLMQSDSPLTYKSLISIFLMGKI